MSGYSKVLTVSDEYIGLAIPVSSKKMTERIVEVGTNHKLIMFRGVPGSKDRIYMSYGRNARELQLTAHSLTGMVLKERDDRYEDINLSKSYVRLEQYWLFRLYISVTHYNEDEINSIKHQATTAIQLLKANPYRRKYEWDTIQDFSFSDKTTYEREMSKEVIEITYSTVKRHNINDGVAIQRVS